MSATVDHFLTIDGINGPAALPDSIKGTGFAILWHRFPIVHPVNPATAGLNQGTARTTAKPFNVIIESANTSPIASAFSQKKLLNFHLVLTHRIGENPVPLFTIDLTQSTIIGYKEASWRSFEKLTELPPFTTVEELSNSSSTSRRGVGSPPGGGPEEMPEEILDRRNSSVLLLTIKPQIIETTYSATDATGTAEGNVAGYFNFLTQKSTK
jgi:hypothetical protein